MKKNTDGRIYIDSYILQKDYRIRLPKAIENNLGAVPGESFFDIYFDAKSREIILKLSEKEMVKEE